MHETSSAPKPYKSSQFCSVSLSLPWSLSFYTYKDQRCSLLSREGVTLQELHTIFWNANTFEGSYLCNFLWGLSWINWVESKGSPPTWACTAELGWCSQTLAIKTTKEVPGASVRVGEYIGSRLLAASILVNNGGHWLCYALCWYRHCKPRQER